MSVQRTLSIICLVVSFSLVAVEMPVYPDGLGAPKQVALSRSSKGNELTWEPLEGADGYRIYKSNTPDGVYKQLAATKRTTYLHAKAPADAFYKVCAYKGKANGPFSNVMGSVAPPGAVEFTVENNNIMFTWTASEYATSYTLMMADSSEGPWTAVSENITDPAAAVTVESSAPCFFYVIPFYNNTAGGSGSVVPVFQPISNVSVICEETYANGPTDKLNVQWDACPGATQYEVMRATLPSDEYSVIGSAENTYIRDTRHPKEAYSYKVRPIYGDLMGAESEPVTLWSGMPDNVLPDSDIAGDSGIVLLVNKKAQIVTAYVRDANGEYTIPLRHMICSTGKTYERTPLGEFLLSSKLGQWYRYPAGTYIRYPSTYTSGLYFHSVLYNKQKNLIRKTIDLLGSRQSLGCVRLKVNDARWVYSYLVSAANPTNVVIVDGWAIPGLLRALKPKDVKIK